MRHRIFSFLCTVYFTQALILQFRLQFEFNRESTAPRSAGDFSACPPLPSPPAGPWQCALSGLPEDNFLDSFLAGEQVLSICRRWRTRGTLEALQERVELKGS